LELRRGDGRAREDAIAKAGGEAFDLRLDARGEVDGATVGYVAVRPADVLSLRRARRIEHALLRNEGERTLRDLSTPRRTLRVDARARPTVGVRREREHEAERGGERRLERQDRVRSAPGEERLRARTVERGAREVPRVAHRAQPETHERQRSPRKSDGREEI